jgi:3',5'-cyclic AMP phosphodiesterase CpdA
VSLGPLRLVACDSTRPGADSGQLDADRLTWLEDVLAADDSTPTMLAMHHPPLLTAVPALDALGLPDAELAALADIVHRHPNVSLIVAGHVHRAIAGQLGACRVLAAPSLYSGFVLDFFAERIDPIATPPGYVVHTLRDGRFVSHVESLPTG